MSRRCLGRPDLRGPDTPPELVCQVRTIRLSGMCRSCDPVKDQPKTKANVVSLLGDDGVVRVAELRPCSKFCGRKKVPAFGRAMVDGEVVCLSCQAKGAS